MAGIRPEQVEAMGPNAVGKCQAGGSSKSGSAAAGTVAGAAAGQSSTSPAATSTSTNKGSGTSAAGGSGFPPGKPVVIVDPNKAGWLLIELVDETGAPMPGEPYRVKLPTGKIVEGNLDAQGTVRIEGIDEAKCKVGFPQRDDAGWQSA